MRSKFDAAFLVDFAAWLSVPFAIVFSWSQRKGISMKYTVMLGRFLFSILFITAAPAHFYSQTINYAAAMGVPLSGFLVPFSGLMAFMGGLSILLGYKAKWGAWTLVMFLVPVTLMMHAYWRLSDPMQAQIQHIMFMKNTALTGAALLIAYFGAGPGSVDSLLASRNSTLSGNY